MNTKIAYAGNRNLAVACLDMLLEQGIEPVALLAPKESSIAGELSRRLPSVPFLSGNNFHSNQGLELLQSLDLDYFVSVHFPYIVPKELLAIPRVGCLNLHPALLPYNRGWHTPSWAILDQTPYGATLHWMEEGLDTGPIALQKELRVRPSDTADSLYQRVLKVELDVFQRAVPMMISRTLPRIPQPAGGTSHRREDLLRDEIQELNLESSVKVGDLIRRLRALSTDRWEESAFFAEEGQRYRIRVSIREEVPTRS